MTNDDPQPILHLRHLGKAPRARVARIARAALEESTSLDRDAVEKTLAAIQSVLPALVNTAVRGFAVQPRPGDTENTCTGGHACTQLKTLKFSGKTWCIEESCTTQACTSHTCSTNACSTQTCPGASCGSNAPPPHDNTFTSEAFVRVRDRLDQLARSEERVQPFSISVDSERLDTSEE